MTLKVDIGRLQIGLHGVSAQLIEAAVQDLDAELGGRIGARQLGRGLMRQSGSIEISELSISPMHLGASIDVAGVRGLIADRLLDLIETRYLSVQEAEGVNS